MFIVWFVDCINGGETSWMGVDIIPISSMVKMKSFLPWNCAVVRCECGIVMMIRNLFGFSCIGVARGQLPTTRRLL